MSKSEAISVAVRLRPKVALEQDITDPAKGKEVVTVDEDTRSITLGTTTVQFDAVFPQSSTQDDVYEYVRGSVHKVATGVNCTIFAYGQTGSGKTHTMLGSNLELELLASETTEPSANWGIVPRAVCDLFDVLREASAEGTSAVVSCSYLQIYNDKLYDLLADRRNKKPLAVREQERARKTEVFVSGLSEYRVATPEDVLVLLQIGGANRAIRGTEANEASSRSHAVLTLSVEVETTADAGSTVIRRAKLNLVDLAGSEKWNTKVDMVKAHQSELININKSLSALGNCVSALTDPSRKHVPYRDSKLTRILQDSLGGNCHTTIIATLSPIAANTEDSLSTLQFADRARHVHTKVKVNEVVDDGILLARALKTIAQLKKQLAEQSSEKITALETEIRTLRFENAKLQEQVRQLSASAAYGKQSSSKRAHKQQAQPQQQQRSPPVTIPALPVQSPDDSYGEEFDVDGDGEEARLMAIAKEAGIGTLSDGVPFGSAEFGDMALLAGEATDSELAELSAALAAMAEQRRQLEEQLAGMGKAPIDPIPESAERSDSPEGSTPEKFLAPRGYPALPSLVPPPSSQPHTHKTGSAGLTRAQSEAALGSRSISSADGNAVARKALPPLSFDTVYRQKPNPIAAGYRPLVPPAQKPPAAAGVATPVAKKEERKQQIRSAYKGGMATGAVYSQPLTRTTQKAQRKKGAGGGDDDDDDADSLSTVSDKEDLTQQEICTPRFCFDKRDVGCKVKIYNARFDSWFSGDIVSYDPIKRLHLVVYEDCSRKWHSMREKDFEVENFAVAQAFVSKPSRPAPKPKGKLKKKGKSRGRKPKPQGKQTKESSKSKPKPSPVRVRGREPSLSSSDSNSYTESDSYSDDDTAAAAGAGPSVKVFM